MTEWYRQIYPHLYYFFYTSHFTVQILLALLVYGVWCAVAAVCDRRFPRGWRRVCACLVPVALMVIYVFTLYDRPTGEFDNRFIPLQSLILFWGDMQVFREMFLNTMLFVPLGGALTFALPAEQRRLWIVVAVAFALSLTVEILQAALSIGFFETDDVLLNTLGGLLGGLSYRIAAWKRKKKA